MSNKLLAGVMLALLALAPVQAQDKTWLHGASLIGEVKYPQGFTHFDYADPEAPKGGTVRLSAVGTFDTFNPVLPKGDAAIGLGLVYETLTDSAMDEVSTAYGHLAEAFSFPDDFSSVTFRMNPKAKWHDGKPVTAEDVVWSFNTVIRLSPAYQNYYANVTKAEVTAPGEVTFSFDTTGNRELPQIMGQLLVMPQHWWEGTGPDGKARDIGASTLEPPLGSGPYRIESFVAGRTITYKRVPDYWALNEPTGLGLNNFDELRYEYFRDETVAFEGFKGDQFDFWQESTARRWATGYDFPAVAEGRVIKELFENPFRDSGILFGFVPNLRLEKFKDARVRQALSYAFDFEEMNKRLFYSQYVRINSYFFGSELASSGLPEGKELEILQSVKDLIPAQVFTTPFENPVAGDAQSLRANLGKALKLLTEAGYRLDGNRLVDASGTQFGFEILLDNAILEPMVTAFQTNLKQIGIDASIRIVDPTQYANRLGTFDFDMVNERWVQSLSPGNEQRDFWGSAAAAQDNSRNYAGIADKGIDALIDKVVFAPDRETLIAATKALDRVLLANHFTVPTYTLRTARIARWDRFSHPETLPEYAIGFPTTWWYDEAKAAKAAGN